MKKTILFIAIILLVFTMSSCSSPEEDQIPEVTANYNTIGILSYISVSFLSEQSGDVDLSNLGLTQLKNDKDKDKEDEDSTTAIEDELDRVNMYVDKFKSFIGNGTEGFGSIEEQPSDRLDYEHMIQVNIDETEFLLYYNIDLDTLVITGLFILDDVEYGIVVENSVFIEKVDAEESKKNIKLLARNGSNTIIIEYELKQEDNEMKQSFSIVSSINGVIDTIEIEIKVEDDEYILELIENGNQYKFKTDTDESGVASYKLDYTVDGIKGKVQIIERVNEDGVTVYVYRIQERNQKIEIEMEDPDVIEDSSEPVE